MIPTRLARALSAACLALLLAPLGAAQAQGVRIAAVVNDQVISVNDFTARMGLVLASSSIPDDPQTRARIATQVMRQMIDEKLELQEAKKEDVKVTDEEVGRQLAGLAKSNHLSPDQLDKYLAEHRIDKETLVQQITAQLTWARLVQRRYGHTVTVGEDEVNEYVKRAEAEETKPQNHVAEIFLSVDSPQQDEDVHQLANKLVKDIQGGAPFPSVARQFSQSPTAAVGGEVGWVLPGMLDPDVEAIIDGMQPGAMTLPLRMAGGYYIYYLVDRRTPESAQANVVVNLAQVVFPLAENADAATRQATIEKAQKATADMQSCGEVNKLGRSVSPDLSGPIGDIKVSDLPQEIRGMVMAADVAKPTQPVPVRGGIGVFMVCRRQGTAGKVDRDVIAQNLRSERLENIAQRYLADLRRVAYIDLRV